MSPTTGVAPPSRGRMCGALQPDDPAAVGDGGERQGQQRLGRVHGARRGLDGGQQRGRGQQRLQLSEGHHVRVHQQMHW
jgi:hypothetical protein